MFTFEIDSENAIVVCTLERKRPLVRLAATRNEEMIWNFFAASTVLSGNCLTIGQPGLLDKRIDQTLADNRNLQGGKSCWRQCYDNDIGRAILGVGRMDQERR
jgi:hypothetical protein